MQLGAVIASTEGYTSAELERTCRRAEAVCARHDDTPFVIKHALWAARFMRGLPDEVDPFLGWLEQQVERGAPPIDLMMAHASLSVYWNARAAYDAIRHHAERAMALFVPADHPLVARMYGGPGGTAAHVMYVSVLWQTGEVDAAWRHVRDTIARFQSLDPYAYTSALAWQMSLQISSGDAVAVERSAEHMLELTARHEFKYLACSALCGRGWARARLGRGDQARTDLITGTEGTRRMGVRVWFPYYLGLLGDAAIVLGDHDRAARALDEAIELTRTTVDRSHEPELLRQRAKLILARDAQARAPARDAFAAALDLARERGARSPALRIATDLAALLRDEHRGDEAARILRREIAWFPAELDDPNLAAARALLGELPAGA
jgi:hypothetical protein